MSQYNSLAGFTWRLVTLNKAQEIKMNLYGGAGMHDTATVGHLILVRVLWVVVVIHRMNDAQIEEQAILKINTF